jgi:hypothetical protein
MSLDISKFLEGMASQLSRERAAAIEEACEAAMQTGDSGVSVNNYMSGRWEVKVDPNVPYGQIWERNLPG